jgi:peptide/nickel transport system permease protein
MGYKYMKQFFKLLKTGPFAIIGLFIILCVVLAAILGRYIVPYDPETMDLSNRLKPPFFLNGGTSNHLLGTDMLGKDILSRVICGARESIIVGVSSSLIALVLGVCLGMLSGYLGGLFDVTVMRLVDIMLALPTVMIAIILVAIVGPHSISIVMAMGLSMWSEYAKVIRSRILTLREESFILAAKVSGSSDMGVLVRHILPNIAYILIVVFTLQIGTIILWSAGLNFLGLGGVSLSWGWDIAAGRIYANNAWWLSTVPGMAIFTTVLGFNLFGDWLRDVLDPSLSKIL